MLDLFFGPILGGIINPGIIAPVLKLADAVWSESRAEDERYGVRPQAHKPGHYDALSFQRQAHAEPAPQRSCLRPGRIPDARRLALA